MVRTLNQEASATERKQQPTSSMAELDPEQQRSRCIEGEDDKPEGTLQASSSNSSMKESNPNDPKEWSSRKRWGNFSIVFFNAFIGYFSSAVYIPALNDLREYFDTDLTTVNATIAVYVFFIGLAPLFWGPLSERIGRRPVYLVSMALYTVFTIVCSVANSFALFFVFRILQGVVASAGLAVGGGTVADLFHPHERGRAMSIFMLSTMFGPAFSPIVGGYLAQYMGWRWIFYLCAMVGGAILASNILFLRETLYRPKPEKTEPTTIRERFASLKFNPFVSFRLLLRPDVVLICIPTACVFGWFFYLTTILPNVYLTVYGFTTGSTGLLYLTGGIGNTTGSIVAGIMSDKVYRYNMRRHGKVTPENRLAPIYLGVPFCLVGHLLYGWFVERNLHWFSPLVGYLLYTFGNMYTITIGMTFLIECYLPVSASVVSVGNFARNTAAMLLSLLSVQIRTGLGDGWSYTLGGLMTFSAYMICIPIVQRYGARMRAKHPEND